MRHAIILSLILFIAAAVLVIIALGHPSDDASATTPPDPWRGDEAPQAGCLHEHGWNICNFGEATIKDSYLRTKTYLGRPVGSFDSRCQTFELGRLCFNPANSDDWQVEFDNLGLVDLTSNGYTPLPGSDPHPAVRDWLLSLSEVGVDPWRVAGRIISEPVCQRGRCSQWADKTRFAFPETAVHANDVQREPLGSWMTHPRQSAVTTTDESGLALLPLAGAAVLAVAGLALLATRRRSGPRGVTI